MRSIIRLVLLVTTWAAGAGARAEVKVAEDVWSRDARFSGVDYGVSERLDRAWLVLHFRNEGPCNDSEGGCSLDEPRRVRVPGLIYQPSTKEVLYQEGSQAPVVCARIVRHRFIGSWETVEPTGNCGYRIADVDHFVDDGYQGRQDTRQEIFFGAAAGRR